MLGLKQIASSIHTIGRGVSTIGHAVIDPLEPITPYVPEVMLPAQAGLKVVDKGLDYFDTGKKIYQGVERMRR